MVELAISNQSIQDKISELAKKINEYYNDLVSYDNPLCLIGNFENGSFIFMADLIRKLSVPRKYCFISYNSVHKNNDKVSIVNSKTICVSSLYQSHVLLVEPVIGYESYNDINILVEQLMQWSTASIKIISLLERTVPFPSTMNIDWTGFHIDYFPEGYGMGYLGKNSGMDGIHRNAQYLLRHSQDTLAGEFIVLSDVPPTNPGPSNLET
jgi:hypoxanthine phosphoribosyltransferase